MNNLNLLKCPGCAGKIVINDNDWACYENEYCKYYNGENNYLKNNKPFFGRNIVGKEIEMLKNKDLSLKEKADIKFSILNKYIDFAKKEVSF